MYILLAALFLQAPPSDAATARADTAGELARLRVQVASLELALRSRAERIEEIGKTVEAARDEVRRLGERETEPVAIPFLSAPPEGSDSAGVAKVAVFAPRLRIESTAFHDTLDIRVRRVEAAALRTVGETEVSRLVAEAELPIDRNGALYVAEWTTGEGHSFSLLLIDGASGRPAATVQVRPNMTTGRFLFVAYRTE